MNSTKSLEDYVEGKVLSISFTKIKSGTKGTSSAKFFRINVEIGGKSVTVGEGDDTLKVRIFLMYCSFGTAHINEKDVEIMNQMKPESVLLKRRTDTKQETWEIHNDCLRNWMKGAKNEKVEQGKNSRRTGNALYRSKQKKNSPGQ